ncbi:phage tail tip lysozyme [Nocardia sp. NPDC004722]
MSPDGTRLLDGLDPLPSCAPAGLKGLFKAAEAIIQNEIRMLGSGTPSKAPDLRAALRAQGIDKPDDQSAMIEKYNDHEGAIRKAVSGIQATDKGIVVQTAGIGDVVTNAYDAADAAVRDLNLKIKASLGSVQHRYDDAGKLIEDYLPKNIVDGLFTGVWNTLDTAHNNVHGVSDQAAAAATNIQKGTPDFTSTPEFAAPVSFPGSFFPSGSTPWSAGAGGRGPGGGRPAIIPTGDPPTAMAMMRYLIQEHHFTPEQAAGIISNAEFESSLDVSAKGDEGTAEGLFQWRFNRRSGLHTFAGANIGDWRTQLDYMVKELYGGGFQDAAAEVNANPMNAKSVAEYFDRDYEISSGANTSQRGEHAEELLKAYRRAQSV